MARKPKLSEHIVDEMEKMILNNMKPGDRFPTEKELGNIFSVSRSTVRESVKVLAALGLLTKKGGTKYVSSTVNNCLENPLHIMLSLDVCSISDLLQMRNLLEVDVITAVVNNLQNETIHEIERKVWQLQNPDLSRVEFGAVDISIHETLTTATGNKLLAELLKSIREVLAENRSETDQIFSRKDTVIENRIKLLQALKTRDREKAEACMLEHIELSKMFFGHGMKINALPDSWEA